MAPRSLVLSALAGIASAATIRINVGSGGLSFSPAATTAAVGDVLEFHFFPGVHGVVQGDGADPCNPVPAGTGFSSGILSVASGEYPEVFHVVVNNTNPIYYYCPQANHCAAGMVGIVNPAMAGEISSYMALAQSQGATPGVNPAGAPYGGQFVLLGSLSSSIATSTSGSIAISTSTSVTTSTSVSAITSVSALSGSDATPLPLTSSSGISSAPVSTIDTTSTSVDASGSVVRILSTVTKPTTSCPSGAATPMPPPIIKNGTGGALPTPMPLAPLPGAAMGKGVELIGGALVALAAVMMLA